MKSQLGRKLLAYFLAILFVFIVIMSILFYQMGQAGVQKNYQQLLEKRVEEVSASITNNQEYLGDNLFSSGEEIVQTNREMEEHRHRSGRPGMMRQRDRDHYLMHPRDIQLFNEVLASNIWIISPNENEILVGSNQESMTFSDLTEEQQEFVKKSLEGETLSSELFEMVDSNTLMTAAAPIYNDQHTIIGAVLLHESYSPFGTFIQTVSRWFGLAILIAVGLTFILAIYFTKLFIDPIDLLKQQVQYLTVGDYSERLMINQHDEIGELSLQINRLAVTLDEAKDKEEHFEQMRQDFMSNISHELKTPVTVMKSSLEALNLGILSQEEEKDYHQALYEESVVLERLIQDLLDLSVLQNTQFSIAEDNLNLIDVLNDAVRSQSMLAKEKEIAIEKQYNQLDVPFVGDYTRLRQLFVTILNNALKYSKSNSIVKIKQTTQGSSIIINIHNMGPVIGFDNKDLLFHSFIQLGEDKNQGFGLGLAIAKEIANRHNIQIEVDSSEEEGTSFKLIFNTDLIPINFIINQE